MMGSQQQSPAQPSPTAVPSPAPQNVGAQPRPPANFSAGYMMTPRPNAPARWPMMPPQNRAPYSNTGTQGSALIAQLTQPPSTMVNPQFPSEYKLVIQNLIDIFVCKVASSLCGRGLLTKPIHKLTPVKPTVTA